VGTPALIHCAHGGPAFARAAVAAGWLYGARLPATVYAPVWLADQNWRKPDRARYMAALARHRPACATVIDWETPGQLGEVLSWAEEAASHVTDAVLVVPKVVGGIPDLPALVGGRRVVLAYSVPSSYGACPLPLWEFRGRPVHLLGGSPQEQMRLWGYFTCQGCDVVSADGNVTGMQARRGRFWSAVPGPKGHWRQLSEAGDFRREGLAQECFRRSLDAVRERWDALAAVAAPPAAGV
jgi:hypothetical protein